MTHNVFVDLVTASEAHRTELLAHCYRMVGSLHDAEDLVQETMLRAWRFEDGYDDARGSVRTWLYRIATNACLTYLEGRQRRELPTDLVGPNRQQGVTGLTASQEIPWLGPYPDALAPSADPLAVIESRESIKLAFVAALQHLPPRQRAVLLLRDVLAMPAAEVADLLGTSVASVNSALQRARAHVASVSPAADGAGLAEPSDASSRELLDRYITAFTTMDIDLLKRTLREDAMLQMPPFPAWFLGREEIGTFISTVFARGGSFRFLETRANGQPTLAIYLRRNTDSHKFRHLHVLTLAKDGIARIDGFHDQSLAANFGLPDTLPD